MLARLVLNSSPRDLPSLASQSAAITSVSHPDQPGTILNQSKLHVVPLPVCLPVYLHSQPRQTQRNLGQRREEHRIWKNVNLTFSFIGLKSVSGSSPTPQSKHFKLTSRSLVLAPAFFFSFSCPEPPHLLLHLQSLAHTPPQLARLTPSSVAYPSFAL